MPGGITPLPWSCVIARCICIIARRLSGLVICRRNSGLVSCSRIPGAASAAGDETPLPPEAKPTTTRAWRPEDGDDANALQLATTLGDKELGAYLAELDHTAALRHPHVVMLLAACLEVPRLCIVLEFGAVPGKCIQSRLVKCPLFSQWLDFSCIIRI